MGIDRLTTSLLADAKKEADGTIKTAEWHVEKMLGEEKAKRAILLKRAEEDAEALIEEQRKERLAWASLESKRILSEAREEAIGSVLEELYIMLGNLAKTSAYKDFLKRMVSQALSEMQGAISPVLRCRKEDKQIVQAVISASNAVVDDTLDSAGGFILESRDGKVRLNLTLESLFETRREELRKQVYHQLFESGKAGKLGSESDKIAKRPARQRKAMR